MDAAQRSRHSPPRPLGANCLGIAFVSCRFTLAANTGASPERVGQSWSLLLLPPSLVKVCGAGLVPGKASPHSGWRLVSTCHTSGEKVQVGTTHLAVGWERFHPSLLCPMVLCDSAMLPRSPSWATSASAHPTPALLFPLFLPPHSFLSGHSAAQCLQGLMLFPRVV